MKNRRIPGASPVQTATNPNPTRWWPGFKLITQGFGPCAVARLRRAVSIN